MGTTFKPEFLGCLKECFTACPSLIILDVAIGPSEGGPHAISGCHHKGCVAAVPLIPWVHDSVVLAVLIEDDILDEFAPAIEEALIAFLEGNRDSPPLLRPVKAERKFIVVSNW